MSNTCAQRGQGEQALLMAGVARPTPSSHRHQVGQAVPAVLLLVTALLLGKPGEAQENNYGPTLYRQYCASCHGERGIGDGPMAAYLTVKPLDLTRIASRRSGKFPRDHIVRIIAGEEEIPGHGTRTMPIWGERLQDDVIGTVSKPAIARGRITFLTDYLEGLQGTAEKGVENIVIPGSGPRPGSGP